MEPTTLLVLQSVPIIRPKGFGVPGVKQSRHIDERQSASEFSETEARVREWRLARGTRPDLLANVDSLPALKSIVSALPHAVCVLDRDHVLVVGNAQAQELLGVEEGEQVHLATCLRPLVSDAADETEAALSAALEGDRPRAIDVVPASHPHRMLRLTVGPAAPPLGAVLTMEDVTQLHAARERLARLATTDELTGLPNYRAFQQRLGNLWAEAERGRSFALVFADVDHFKRVNDSLGHAAGNEALAEIAAALRSCIRETDMVARFGGEEFCVLLVDVDESQAASLAERLRVAVEAIDFPAPLTASFGVCAFSKETPHAQALLKTADKALYAAKAAGRNCVVRASTLSAKV